MSTPAVLKSVTKTANEFQGMFLHEIAFENDATKYIAWRSDDRPITFQPGDNVNFEITGEDKRDPSKKKIKFLKAGAIGSGGATPSQAFGGPAKSFSPAATNSKQDYILYNVVRRVALDKLPDGYRNLESLKAYTETVFNGVKALIGNNDVQYAINAQACLKDAAFVEAPNNADPEVMVSLTKTLIEEMDSFVNKTPAAAPKASIPTSFLDNLPKSL